MNLSPKDPSEIVDITFDFSRVSASVSSPTVEIAVASGTADPDVAQMLSGSPQIQSGTKVLQRICNGVVGSNIELRCLVTLDDGSRIVHAALLPIRRASPA